MMRRGRSLLIAAGLAALVGSPLTGTIATAQSSSVNAFVEIATTNPGVGCVVDVSTELRSGGAPVAGADVVVSVVIDGTSDVISSDRATTDDAGVAWLAIDTSAGYDGAKTWMEILVNGAYVGGRTVWIEGGGACSGAPALLDLSGDVPTVSDTTVSSADEAEGQAESTGGEVIIPGIITYQQQRGLSCEYAALSIATGTLGGWVSEYDFEAQIGLSANPHWGYRGYIDGQWGNTDDYGIYAEPLQPALAAFGFQSEVFYGGRGDLQSQLDLGRPTVVWLGMWGDTSFYETTEDGTQYQLTSGMHVMTAYGYDGGGVYLSDPGNGGLRYYDWGTFEWMWSVMDGMALSVYR